MSNGLYLNSKYGRGHNSGSFLSVGKQAARVAIFNRANNINNIIDERKHIKIHSKALLIVNKSFQTRYLPLLSHLIDIGYIPNSIDTKVIEDDIVSIEAAINEYYNNGGRLIFGAHNSAIFFKLKPWFESHSDALYFNSGSRIYATQIDDLIPDNMITTSCNHYRMVQFMFDNVICNIHKHADFLNGSIFDNIFDFVDDSLPNGQAFNQIIYVSDNSELQTKNNFVNTIKNYIQTNFSENSFYKDPVTLQTFTLNITKDTAFPNALDTLLTENPINSSKFSQSNIKSIFIFDCFNSENCQNMLNLFSKKEYANNLIIFNEKFLNLNIVNNLPFYTNFEFPYSFILALNYSELGYKISRHIFNDYNTPLPFIDIFSHMLDIFDRVVSANNLNPVGRLVEYLTNSFSIDRNEWHVKPLYLYGLKERYNENTQKWDFYSSATIFKKSFNDTNTGTASTDETWIDTAISGYPSAPGNTTYSSNSNSYSSSNANYLNNNLNGVSMLFSSMQEITDYTSYLDGFFKGTYKSSTYNGGANPNSTPSIFGIWKMLTNTTWKLNSTSVSPLTIDVTVPSEAVIDGTSTNKNYWLYISYGPISYNYTSYNSSGAVISTTNHDSVTIDLDMTYSASNYIVFFNKGNSYNNIRGPLVINFNLFANQVINKQYRIGDVISISSNPVLGTNVNAAINSISSDGFTFGVTRFENENSNGITSSTLKQNTGITMTLANHNSNAYMYVNPDITNISNNSLNLWSPNGCYYMALLPNGTLVANDYRTGLTFWSSGSGFSNPEPASLQFRILETTVTNPLPQPSTTTYYIELHLLDTTGAERVKILKQSVNLTSLIYPLQLVVTNDRNISIIDASGNTLWSENTNIYLNLTNGNTISNSNNDYKSLYSLSGIYNLTLASNGVLNFTQINSSSSIYNAGTISQCSGWSNVYNLFKNNTTSYAWNNYKWIWNTANSYSSAPVGNVNFYTSYTNTRSTDINATLWCSVDDTLDIYMNGNKLPNYITSWNTIISNTITLKAGVTSFFKFVATNGGGPAGLIFWCLENGNANDSTNTLFFSNNKNATTTNTIYSITNPAAISLQFSYTINSSTNAATFTLGLYNSSNTLVYNILQDGTLQTSTTFDVINNKLVIAPFVAPYSFKISNNGDLIIVDANNNIYWALGKADKSTVTQDLYSIDPTTGASVLTKSEITGISSVHPRQGDYVTVHNPINPQYSGATATISLVNSDKSINAIFYDENDSTTRSNIIYEKPDLRKSLVTDSGVTTGQNFIPVSNTELFNLTSDMGSFDNGYYTTSVSENGIVNVVDNRTKRINWSSSPLEIPSGQTLLKCNGLKLDNDNGSLYVDVISENIGNSTSYIQNVKLYSKYTYKLQFYASGNNPIVVNISPVNNALQPILTYTFTPINSQTQLFTQTFSVSVNDTFTISFYPTFPNFSLINGATIITNDYKVGSGCLSLTASKSQYVAINDSFTTGLTGMSFSFWFKSNNNATWARIFDFGNGSASDNIIVFINNNNLGFSVYNGNLSKQYNSVIPGLNNNTWNHIAWTLDASNGWNIYLNGNLYISLSQVYYPKSIQRTKNYIGKSNWSNDPYFNGEIDDFRYYSRTLTNIDVSNIYINPFNITIYPGISMYISFDNNYTPSTLKNISITNDEKYYIYQNTNASNNSTISSYSLNMQDDGNLCLYQLNTNGTQQFLWGSMTWQTEIWKSTNASFQAYQYNLQNAPPHLISTNGNFYLAMDQGTLGVMSYINGNYNWIDKKFGYVGKPFFYSGQSGVTATTTSGTAQTVYTSGTLWNNYSDTNTRHYWDTMYTNVFNKIAFSNADSTTLVDSVKVIWVSSNSSGVFGSSGGSAGTYNFSYTYNNTTGKTIYSTLWVSVVEKCDIYINNTYTKTVGGTSSSDWQNFWSYDFYLQPGITKFDFKNAYNSKGRCGLAFICFPKYISSCDLYLNNTTGNLMTQNVQILATDNTTVHVSGISDLPAYAITNLSGTSTQSPYNLTFEDDDASTLKITDTANTTLLSTTADPNGEIALSLFVPTDRNGILNAGVKLYAQQDENELESFLWSPSKYSYFGITVDTSSQTQTVCIFDARFTKPVYTFYTSKYTTLTSLDAISYLMLTTSGQINVYNIYGTILYNITSTITGYSNFSLKLDDSNVLYILSNNNVVASLPYNHTWGTFENYILSSETAKYYNGHILTSSNGNYTLTLDNGSLNINSVTDTSYTNSSGNTTVTKDIYTTTLYANLYTYNGSNPSSAYLTFDASGVLKVHDSTEIKCTIGTPNIGIPGYKLILGNTGELAIYDCSIPNAVATDSGSINDCSNWSNVYNKFKGNTSSYAWNNYRWIWNTANSKSGAAPNTTVNFYTTYTNSGTTDINATLWCSVDDYLTIYMNGIMLPNTITQWNTIISNTITLKAGSTNFFKFVAKNAGSSSNPAGLIFWCLNNSDTNDATNTLFFSNPETVYCSDGIIMGPSDFGIQTWTSGTSYSETIPYPNYTIDTSDIPENQLINIEYNFKIPSSSDDKEEYTKIYSPNRLYYLRLEIDGSLAIYLSSSNKRIWSNRRPYSGPNTPARIGFSNGYFGLWDSKGQSYGNKISISSQYLYIFYLGNDRVLRLVGSDGSSTIFNP